MKIHTIQLNIEDFLGGTAHMDATEIGAYWSLLMCAYKTSDHSLPNDPRRLALMAKCSGKVWGRIGGTVMDKFVLTDDEHPKWIHKRVLEDALTYQSRSSINSDNSLKRWKTDKQVASKSQSDGNATYNLVPKNNPPTPQGAGVLKHGFKGKGEGVFRVDDLLHDNARQRARENAPGWSQQELMRVYDEGINDGSRPRPDNANAAFPVWCANYTKGKKP